MQSESTEISSSALKPIKGGWAAEGKDWAVFGESKEEVLQKAEKAKQLHEEIKQRRTSGEQEETAA